MKVAPTFYIALVFTFVLVGLSLTINAQEAPPPPSTTVSDVVSSQEKSSEILKGWAAVITAGAAVLTATWGIISWLLSQRVQQEYSKLKEGIYSPKQVPSGDYRNSTLVVGLGGAGKTELIRSLTNNSNTQPVQKTWQFEIYHMVSRADEPGSPKGGPAHHLFLADYIGQNIGKLIGGFIEAQFQPYSPMAYGFIESLVLIVDVVPPLDGGRSGPSSFDQPDDDRIQQNLDQWSQTAINAVFGLLTDSLRSVILFINKTDTLKSIDFDDIRAKFAPLEERLQKHQLDTPRLLYPPSQTLSSHEQHNLDRRRRRDEDQKRRVPFWIIIGSASGGTGVPVLAKMLKNSSVPGTAHRLGPPSSEL